MKVSKFLLTVLSVFVYCCGSVFLAHVGIASLAGVSGHPYPLVLTLGDLLYQATGVTLVVALVALFNFLRSRKNN